MQTSFLCFYTIFWFANVKLEIKINVFTSVHGSVRKWCHVLHGHLAKLSVYPGSGPANGPGRDFCCYCGLGGVNIVPRGPSRVKTLHRDR